MKIVIGLFFVIVAVGAGLTSRLTRANPGAPKGPGGATAFFFSGDLESDLAHNVLMQYIVYNLEGCVAFIHIVITQMRGKTFSIFFPLGAVHSEL